MTNMIGIHKPKVIECLRRSLGYMLTYYTSRLTREKERGGREVRKKIC